MCRPFLILLAGLAAAPLVPAVHAAPATEPGPAPATTASALRVLRQECFSCHNPEKHKGGLVLTTRDAALKGGAGGPVVVPGRPADSPLVRVLAADADPHMPPKAQLPPQAVAALAGWVEAGAPWDDRVLAEPVATTRPVRYRGLPATYGPVLALALSPDEKTLAVGRGSRVFLHDLTKPDRPPTGVLAGPRDAVQSLAWSPDGTRLAAGDHGRALVWDVRKPEDPPVELEGLAGRVTALLFLPGDSGGGDDGGGTLVAADGGAGSSARLHRFQLPDRRPRVSIDAHADGILSLARDPAGKRLATGGGDRTVRLWDPATLAPVATLEGHTGRVASVAFAPDGGLLASGGADRDLKVWDVATRERKVSVGPHPAPVTAVAWAADRTVAVACEDGSVRLDPSVRAELARPFAAAAEDVPYCLAATADGRTLYAGCHDGRVYVFGPGGKLLAKIAAPEGAATGQP